MGCICECICDMYVCFVGVSMGVGCGGSSWVLVAWCVMAWCMMCGCVPASAQSASSSTSMGYAENTVAAFLTDVAIAASHELPAPTRTLASPSRAGIDSTTSFLMNEVDWYVTSTALTPMQYAQNPDVRAFPVAAVAIGTHTHTHATHHSRTRIHCASLRHCVSVCGCSCDLQPRFGVIVNPTRAVG